MAKAAFHKNQKVFVKPVGTWAVVEQVLPQWVKGLDEPLKVYYDVGLGREFSASELMADKAAALTDEPADLENWRIGRAKNRWAESGEVPNHPYPGTYPVVRTDEKDWGGWRVPTSEYDRDPERIEFQARIIQSAPHLMRVAKALAQFGHNFSDEMPSELLTLSKKCNALLRRIYETSGEIPIPAVAAE